MSSAVWALAKRQHGVAARRQPLELGFTRHAIEHRIAKGRLHPVAQGVYVETDGLTYHRTPAQQTRDRLRDQTHAANGLTTVRFTHAQIAHDPDHVQTTLAAVARRLSR